MFEYRITKYDPRKRDTDIHVGWDYYLYIGIPCEPSASIEAARGDGLFVEPFESPYKAR
jgi:hypothetical protein